MVSIVYIYFYTRCICWAQVVHTIVTRVIRVWNQGEFSIVATSVITSSLRFKWVVPPLFYLVLLSAVFEIFIIVNIDKK